MLAELEAEAEALLKTPEGQLDERRERWEELRAVWHATVPPRRPRRRWTKCGARCRDGHPCQAPPVRDRKLLCNRNGRCRMHGGLSTGPRTPEGKARVAEAARRTMLERWKAGFESPIGGPLSNRGFRAWAANRR
jgi:hypothetical protein